MLRLRTVSCVVAGMLVACGALAARADEPAYAWSEVAVQQPPPTMHPGEVVTLTVVLRNDGTATWSGEEVSATPVRLGAAEPRDRLSAFASQDPTWLWSGGRRVRMESWVVPTGALASFTFTFRAPETGGYPRTHTERFAPLVEGGEWMDSHTIALRTTVLPLAGAVPPIPPLPPVPAPEPLPSPPSPSPVPEPTIPPPPTPTWPPGYAWEPVFVQPAPATMHPGQKLVLTVALRNTGQETWNADDLSSTPMRLAAVDASGAERASAFGREDPTWIWSGGRRIRMDTPSVPAGAVGAFSFTFTAPTYPSYPQPVVERFAPIVEGVALLASRSISFATQVRPAAAGLQPLPEAPPMSPTPPLPTLPTPPQSPLPSQLPTPSLSPLPEPSPVPSVTPPGASCPSSASLRPADVTPPAAAAGYAPSGTLLSGKVTAPQAVAYGFAKIFAADGDRIAKTDLAGFATEYFGATGSGPGQFRWPSGIAVSDSAVVFVTDTGNNRIQAFAFAGLYVAQFGAEGSEPGQFRAPHGISVIPNGPLAGNLAIADTGNNRIQITSRTGIPIAVIGGPGIGPGQFSSPTGVAVWGDDIFVADTGNERIQRLTLAGEPTGIWGGPGSDGGCTSTPTGIIANAYGVFVVSNGTGRVERFTRWGLLLETFGAMTSPVAITIDPTAKIYVTESGRLARFGPAVALAPPAP